jgi:hypothetical protein
MLSRFLFGFSVLLLLWSCRRQPAMTDEERAAIKDSVIRMMTQISVDITKGGPTQWLPYFEDDPGFFMASDGAIKFGDYRSATMYIRDTLPQIMSRISLTWRNLHVDPLTPEFAAISADFSEDIRLSGGQAISDSGFFTAIAHFDGTTWKLRNLNWASKLR